jgi:signal transduction histidine kinase
MDFSTLLASTVHDMKNSIGLLTNALDELTAECASCGCGSAHKLPPLRYEANRLNGNLLQLLTLYKIDRASVSLNIADHNVFDFLKENLLGNAGLLDSKGISLELECPEDLAWFFDRELVSGVVNNVLNNAYKYAGDRIKVSASRDGAGLVITIEDNGKGYPASLTAAAIAGPERFVHFSSGSTGLGLYFAALIAAMHRNGDREGTVSVSNGGPLGGGCFRIALP